MMSGPLNSLFTISLSALLQSVPAEGRFPRLLAHILQWIPSSGTIGLPADALHRNILRGQHLMLQRVHARRRFVDTASERDRSLEDRFQTFAVLNAGARILMLDDEIGFRGIERQELPG